ncbi:MAG TPA: acyl-CoA dehydrogenase family protein [Myxococcota bacterium]|nr:acyl-CoA dehydrogenase family protein [Myxococcota bacterium]
MNFALSEEQELLQSTLRGFVAKECTPRLVRAIFDGERQSVPALWKGLAEVGVAGLAVPESHGGAGLELLELALVAEELGRGAVPVPFLGHALATLALARGGSAAQQAAWLPRLAAGDERATVALAEDGGRWLPSEWNVELANGRVRGRKALVPEAEGAELFVVGCRGGALALVEAGGSVRVETEPTLDRGRPLATLELDGAPAERLTNADAERLVDAGCVLLAADAFGAAHQLVRATAAYLQTRRQFGQSLAQFQALKHQLANMALDVDPARGLWWYAAHAFDHAPAEASRAASLAKAHITERAQQVARDAFECHGGIGFTWECDVHLWFKRVLFDRLWLGAPELHRERYAALEGW